MKYLILSIVILVSGCNTNKNMNEIAPFYVVGIVMETTNENGKSMEDMGKLWGRFYSESIFDKIPNKLSEDVYSVFTDYDSDYTGSYTALIGHRVQSLDDIPTGLVGKQIRGGTYQKFVAFGKMPDAIVDTWKEIWKKDSELDRRYTSDYEVYGSKSDNGENSEIEIFVAVN